MARAAVTSPLWAPPQDDQAWSRWRRTRRALLACYFAALLAAAAGIAIYSAREREEVLAEVEQRARQMARAVEQHEARLLDAAAQFLVQTREVIELSGEGGPGFAPMRLQRIFAAMQLHGGALRPPFLFDREGRRVPLESGDALRPYSIAGRPSFEAHRASGNRDVLVSPPIRSSVDDQWVVPVTVRLERPGGEFDGIIATAIEVSNVANIYRSVGEQPGMVIIVLSLDSVIFMRHPFDEALIGTKASIPAPEGERTFRAVSPFDGLVKIGASRRVAGYPLFVLVAQDRDTVLAGWRQWTVRRAVVAGLVALVITALLLAHLHRLERECKLTVDLQRFKSAVDHSADLVYWIQHDGHVAYTNAAAARQLGYTQQEIQGLRVTDFDPEFDEARWQEQWTRLEKAGEVRLESIHRRRDGTTYPVGISATLVRIDDQVYAFAIGRDLTSQKCIEHEIRELNADLERRVRQRTEQLEAANAELESFGYSVSHDLGAPLRHLSGYADFLIKDHASEVSRPAHQLIERIGERAGYMSRLVQALFDLSRTGRGPLTIVDLDLSAIAAEVVADLRTAEPMREVEVTIEPGMRAPGDLVLVRTALQNLIGNAWKYSARTAAARIEVGSVAEGNGRAFFVRDNGAGFDSRDASRLFGAFQRLHSQSEFEGTGIGLATVQRIVRRHGGRVWAEGESGRGATFWFTLAAD